MMNFIKNNLANALTLGNLFCGSIAVIHIINNDYQILAICLSTFVGFRFFDGFVARALKSNSNLGCSARFFGRHGKFWCSAWFNYVQF